MESNHHEEAQVDCRPAEPLERGVELESLRTVVNELPVILFAADARGTVRLSEGGGLKALGFAPGELIGVSTFEMYRDVPWVLANLARTLDGETCTSSGQVAGVTFEATLVPLFGHERNVIGLLGLALDVTRRARIEKERLLLIDQLRGALEVRDTFLATASHELRTPLSALSLKLELLLGRMHTAGAARPAGELVHEVDHELDYVMRQVRRLTRLVNDLLDVSRVAQGRLALSRQQIDLAQLVKETAARMRQQFERTGTPFVVEAGGEVFGSWDRMRIEQVLENLLTNALKHGMGGAVEVRVTSDDRSATLAVRDHGPGIPSDLQQHVFERFVRLAPKGVGGLGLGLHLCRQIVEAHGGRIWLESEVGRGATFVVNLPRDTKELKS